MAWSIFTDGGGSQVAVGWAHQLLQALGAPDTPGNVEFIYQWEKSEGGGGKYNPLNQGPVAGKPYLTTTGEQFGGGAADFASWSAGLQGAVDYLHYSNYKGVLAGLMSNNPTAARSALWASPWAASHYGYGSNWYFGTVPGGTPILPVQGGGVGTGVTATDVSLMLGKSLTCAWSIDTPTVSASLTGGLQTGTTSHCVMSKVALRQLAGIGLIAGGLLITSFGIGFLAVMVFRRAGVDPLGANRFTHRVFPYTPRASYRPPPWRGDPAADNLVDTDVGSIAPSSTPPVGSV